MKTNFLKKILLIQCILFLMVGKHTFAGSNFSVSNKSKILEESNLFIKNLIIKNEDAVEFLIRKKPFFKDKKKKVKNLLQQYLFNEYGEFEAYFDLAGTMETPPLLNVTYILYGAKKSLLASLMFIKDENHHKIAFVDFSDIDSEKVLIEKMKKTPLSEGVLDDACRMILENLNNETSAEILSKYFYKKDSVAIHSKIKQLKKNLGKDLNRIKISDSKNFRFGKKILIKNYFLSKKGFYWRNIIFYIRVTDKEPLIESISVEKDRKKTYFIFRNS